jgi:hypothetical protein
MDESTNGLQNESTQPPAEMTASAGEQASADAEAKKSGKEDLKAALANLASALNKFGAVAEVRAREEWKQAKPEIQKALAEMKRAVETGSQKASTTIDSLGKKMDKNKTGEQGATTGTEDTSPINPTGRSDASKDDSAPPGA